MQRTEIGGKEIVEVFLGRGFTTHVLSYTTRMAQWSEIIFKVDFFTVFHLRLCLSGVDVGGKINSKHIP